MKNRQKLFLLAATLLLLAGGGWFLYSSGFFQAVRSLDVLRDYIDRSAPYSHLLFFLVQFLSVVLAPIPSNITAAAGGLLFGTWPAFLLTFSLARALGRDFADRLVSRKLSEKYQDVLRTKAPVFLVLAFLFPFFPDDMLCILAGLTDISFRRLDRPDVDAGLAQLIREQQKHCRQTYGYRRMWMWLGKQGIHHNPKTVLRIMKKYDLLAEIRRPRKWVNMGQQVHRYENLLNRDFHADRPNSKWVTDISYIHTEQSILYLSMIRDLYDNSIVAYKTAQSQTINLVLDTIRLAVKQEKTKVAGRLQLHSDQGFQYTSQAYFNLTKYTFYVKTRKLL